MCWGREVFQKLFQTIPEPPTLAVTRRRSSSLIVTCCHLPSLAVTLHSLSLLVAHRHLSSLVVTRCHALAAGLCVMIRSLTGSALAAGRCILIRWREVPWRLDVVFRLGFPRGEFGRGSAQAASDYWPAGVLGMTGSALAVGRCIMISFSKGRAREGKCLGCIR